MRGKLKFESRISSIIRGVVPVLLVFLLPLLVAAWKLNSSGINPRYVQRIEDGKTKKHEILTWFGDPQEINRLPEGVVYVYKTYRPKEELPKRSSRESKGTLSPVDPYSLDKAAPILKSSAQESAKKLASTLVIRFQADGETVQSHDYQEF